MCICCWNISACNVQNCGKCAANVDKCETCNDGFYTTSDTSCTGKYRTIISMTDIFRIIYFDTPSYVIFYCVCERQWLSLALSFSPLSLSLALSLSLICTIIYNLNNHSCSHTLHCNVVEMYVSIFYILMITLTLLLLLSYSLLMALKFFTRRVYL